MDHLDNNMTSRLRVTQQYFVITSCLFLNYLSNFIAEYVFLLKLSRIKVSTIPRSKKPCYISATFIVTLYFVAR